MKVRLLNSLMIYQRKYDLGDMLISTGGYMPKGSEVVVFDSQTMALDNHPESAVPFFQNGEEFFFLEEEFKKSTRESPKLFPV